MFIFLKSKKKKNSHCIQKKKVNKDTRLFWNSAAWILTRFCWERVQALGEGSGTGMSSRQRAALPQLWPQMGDRGSGRRHTQTHRKTGCNSSSHYRFPRNVSFRDLKEAEAGWEARRKS